MFLFQLIENNIINIAKKKYDINQEEIISKIVLEPSKSKDHGDFASNIAMVLAKQLKKNPKDLAQEIILKLQDKNFHCEIAGAGFINITVNQELLFKELLMILQEKENYGGYDFGKNLKVNIEFVSANPTGPLHIGHARNAVVGDIIANILKKVGFSITKEYYVNDAGGQIENLAKSLYLRYQEVLGKIIKESDFNEDMYKGSYLIDIAKELALEKNDSFKNIDFKDCKDYFISFALEKLLVQNKNHLKSLGVEMDLYTSEKQILEEKYIEKAIEILEKNNDLYRGILEQPKGMAVDDWEPREQFLFRSTKYGDDVDRPMLKSDNSWTYFAGDVAYHYHKIIRGFDKIINIFGADHSGYVKRIYACVKGLKIDQDFVVKVTQMVNFSEDGQAIRMSKRAGNFITIEDAVKKVGKDPIRFFMISRHQDTSIDFDFTKVIEENKDNLLFYIQYAYARINSVLKQANKIFVNISENIFNKEDFFLLTDPNELAMIKMLANYPRQVKFSALYLEPHRLANYLYDLATLFHSFWNKGREDNNLRFITENDFALTKARIGLISGVMFILSSGLKLLGIEPLKEMH